MITAQTLKGFRDFLPADAIKRQRLIQTMKSVFAQYGFDPLETPALEYADTLLGKYGEEADKLLYIFEDRGGRKVGLRYDQTVPASRVVAQYGNTLAMPFKRYQVQPVWRAENPQRGRYREFLQCDIDIFGEASYMADAEIIVTVGKTLERVGFNKYSILVNDRTLFGDAPLGAIMVIDKIKKIGVEGVQKELTEKGFDPTLLSKIKNNKPSERLSQIIAAVESLGISREHIVFDPTLARGLDYYTSTIFEVELDGAAGSIGGGGRYDKLIGQFTGKDVPAIGFAFGFDRLLEAMIQAQLVPETKTEAQVYVSVFAKDLLSSALAITSQLRSAGITTDVCMNDDMKLEKQLKFAAAKGVPYVIIQGPDEADRNVVKLKNLSTKTQEELSLAAVIDKLSAAS
jgi:histidyl-tRNA synthetase